MDELIITVRFFNVLSKYAGKQQIEIHLPSGSTLRQALETLDNRDTPQLHQILFTDGNISKYIKIFRNQNLITQELYELNLENGDEIMLLPAIAGG